MSLPSVPRLPPVIVPFPVTVPFSTAPRPRPLQDRPLVLDSALPASVQRRRERLEQDPDGVFVRDPEDPDDDGLTAALHAACALVPVTPDGLEPLAAARSFGLGCSDDLVVLRRRGDRATCELLAVAFPSGWPPRERAGADLVRLHAPVADGDRLRAASRALSEAALTKGPYRQHVWGFEPDGRLDRDPSAPDATGYGCPDPAHWWMRVEAQTTIPLPHLSRALFLIRPYLVPLVDLAAGQRHTLAAAVASMSPAALDYKGIAQIRDNMINWLRSSGGPSCSDGFSSSPGHRSPTP